MKKINKFLGMLGLAGITAFLLSSCTSSASSDETTTTIRVAAASSVQDVMKEMKKEFTTQHPDIDITFHFGSSGSLKQQIAQGAPVDVFVSASTDKVRQLIEGGHMKEKDTELIMQNSLVLIAPEDTTISIHNIEELKDMPGRTAVGTPESVPAGKYAKESLEHAGIWDTLQENLVRAKNVRQVLTYVEKQNVEAGFVYKTDALLSDKITILTEVDPGYHTPIEYPAGITVQSEKKEEAQELLTFLQDRDMQKIAEDYGFKTGAENQ